MHTIDKNLRSDLQVLRTLHRVVYEKGDLEHSMAEQASEILRRVYQKINV